MNLEEHNLRKQKESENKKETKDFLERLENHTRNLAYLLGYDDCRKEYEEKLRWISVEEKLPPLNEYVLFKYSEGEYCVGCLKNYGYYCTTYIPAYNDFSSINLLSEVTHWRRFL